MKCYKCGNEINKTSLICFNCGAPKIHFSKKQLIKYYLDKILYC